MTTLVALLLGVWMELGARQVWFIVGEKTIKFGRVRPFPASAIRAFSPVAGKEEIRVLREKLIAGTNILNMRTNPNPHMKGFLAPKWVDAAVLVEADPSIGPMHTFVIGTRHQRELLDALAAVAPARETAGAWS